MTISGMRNEELVNTVDVACQFLVQNTRSDHQVNHQPKKNDLFQHTVQTPLSIGLPLAIHSRVRDKNLVNILSDVYIGSDYRRILDLERRVEQAVLQRMKETGGFCLPDFVKKGKNIWFAIDNIDLLEDWTEHVPWHSDHDKTASRRWRACKPIIPEKLLSPAPLEFEVKHTEEKIIRNKPVRFAVYHLGKRNSMISKDFTHTWALANYFATDDNRGEIPNNPHDSEDQQGNSDCENARNPDNSILSVQTQIRNGGKLAKEEGIPTWAATKSLLLSQSSQSHGRPDTEVIAPLFRTSPTHHIRIVGQSLA